MAGSGPADESSNLSRATNKLSLVSNEKIVKALWELRSLSPVSQKVYAKNIKRLSRQVNLDNSVQTEKYILSLNGSSKYKANLLMSYQHYCKANGISWIRPRLKTQTRAIVVPTEERIDKIISCGSLKYVTIFSLSKHGLRPDEISKITLRDIDFERGLLTVRTSKLGAERIIKLKENALENLRTYIKRKNITELIVPFFPKAGNLRERWNAYRRRAYLNFRDPELLKIRLYDLRHWFATITYMKTRDPFHVKYVLGHRHIQSTLIYVHLAQGLVNTSEDYTCKVARTLEEATQLIEAGFEYVTEMDGTKIFRKRK